MNPINKNTLNYYASTNEKSITGEVKAVVVEFPGLGGGSCLGGVDEPGEYTGEYAEECAKRGILLSYCFTGHWSWMDKGAVRIADAIIDAIFDRFELSDTTPIISTGGSMGGLGALIYSCSARRTPVACAANGPCCDAIVAYYAHPSFPRTFYRAIAEYDMPFEDALKSISPLYRVADMPFIPYYIVHTGADEVLPVEKHSERFVHKMRELGHDVTFVLEPERLHCDITQPVRDKFNQFIYKQAEKWAEK